MRLSGQARIEDLELVLEPLAVRGRLEIEDGSVQLPDSAPISFRGAIVATGEALRGEGIAVGTAEQELAIGLEIRELFDRLLLDFEARAEDLDTNRIVTAVAGAPDRVEGPLDFEMELDGPLGGDGELLSSLRGRLDASIDGGRIIGFSPLRVVFDQVGGLGSAGLELSRVFLGESVQEYYGDDFERASVALRLANGIVHDELEIQYRGYTVDLEGTVDAGTRELDNTGRIVIAGELDAIIARGLGARGYNPRARSIPLASVTGRLYDPRIELAQHETLAFVTTYAQDLYGATAQKIIESEVSKQLGDAAGKALGDAAADLLGDLFGGGSDSKKR
jgi:hypothetical protein